ncbi:MAG: hypothetical protein EU532_12350 [Promethearchaeota archaeon]|nr:MAG: hypothetical protein EU532_12350 [Candidatus Lokiarchaeota archaeon]
MLRTYIYNAINNTWIEEEHELLFHDICAILDDNFSKIYLWKGPKSTKNALEKGIKSLNELISTFHDIEIIVLNKHVPPQIKNRLDLLLESVKREENLEKYEFTHFITIRSYFFLSLVALTLFIIYLISLWSAIYWPMSSLNFMISATTYMYWLNISKVLLVVIISFLSILFAISIYEYDVQAIVISLAGLIISISMILYLQQGIFLFLFQSGSDSLTYLIKTSDLILFLLLLSFSTLLFIFPSFIKVMFFFKTYKQFIF